MISLPCTRRSGTCILAIVLVASTARGAIEIQVTPNGSAMQQLAAKEVVRYVYLRTGFLPEKIAEDGKIVVARKDSALLSDALVHAAVKDLQPQQYVLRAAQTNGTRTWWIVGGDDVGTLYGVYRFAEKLGVRFYLHGDVIPDERLAMIPNMDDIGNPLFDLRGINPWGSHPFGFDAWTTEDYKTIFSQLAKMRMNFLGIHCYPEGHPYAEPTVWHGVAADFDAQGRVKASYVSRYFNTLLTPAWGDYLPKRTSDYSFGGALLFEDDAWAPEVMRGYCPLPQTPDACNEVFNRTAIQFREAFTFAQQLGIKTCIGTESPLIMPNALQERIKAQGKDPNDPAVVREVYESTFRRIMASHPLDYYWLWTPEGWTWEGNSREKYGATVSDVKLAAEALESVGAPIQLATCGWVLGPQHDRAAFDKDLPKNIPTSAISRDTGAANVDGAFRRIVGREKWAIPWLESDNREGLASVQLFAGRMRRDAADALAYGCTGLIGLQWRTEILAPNVTALAAAAWDQSGWNVSPGNSSSDLAAPTDGALGGVTAAYPGRTIAGTRDDLPYQTCRYNFDGYNLKVPNGRYHVTLGFCEPHFDQAGERIGDFQLQGTTVVEGLDIFARVGKFAALDLVFDGIDVTDGCLRLRIEARKSWPCISTIVIEGAGFVRKINCGGPAHEDYEADLAAADTKPRSLPCEDFYADWATVNFGRAEIGEVFAEMDGKMPLVTDGGCPAGKLTPMAMPWIAVAPQFAFVDQLESFRPSVCGGGNLQRFDYWLNIFKYCRSLAQLRCALAKPDAAERSRLYAEVYRYLLETVNTPGALAMVVNLENHPGWQLAPNPEQPWPKDYQGSPRYLRCRTRPTPLGPCRKHAARWPVRCPDLGRVGCCGSPRIDCRCCDPVPDRRKAA
ncbi:MAG: malectin domain-containing carbohydrate-binding protein [Pirellulaceae bacterium]